ncbi:MAG: hypothetical protein IJQ72_05185 [Bacilli bacterium]|nr:hypothetical protein [Bacilli bacterium]
MKKVNRILKGRKHICFLDFEGTQFSHEMIAYGAYFTYVNKEGQITKAKSPIRNYVKSKNSIGRFVKELTGITEKDLEMYGVEFSKAINEIKKYCGMAFKKTLFVTFGNHDIRILNQSCSYNLDAPKELCDIIKKNYFDFQSLISEFVKDDIGNPLSLTHYLELFGIEFDGKAHDPMYDAVNLAKLYSVFLKEKDIVLEQYCKVLNRSNIGPEPVNKAIKKLLNGESVSPEEFKQFIKEYID